MKPLKPPYATLRLTLNYTNKFDGWHLLLEADALEKFAEKLREAQEVRQWVADYRDKEL